MKDYRGPALDNGHNLTPNGVYLEGNAKLVTQFYQRMLDREHVRVCYFGDHLWSDVYAASTHRSAPDLPKWDSIAVIEDLHWHDKQMSEGEDAHMIDLTEFWGSNFFFDTIEGRPVKNYFIAEAEKHSRYALPFVKNLTRLVSHRA